MQATFLARLLAWVRAGNNSAARMPMIAITTKSSIKVNALVNIGHGRYLVVSWRIVCKDNVFPFGASASGFSM